MLGAGHPGQEKPSETLNPSSEGSSDREHQSLIELPVDLIQRGKYQPRGDMDPDSLKELADSISAQGVMQPIILRELATAPPSGAKYEIVAGERRWRAARMIGLEAIPACVVKDLRRDERIAA